MAKKKTSLVDAAKRLNASRSDAAPAAEEEKKPAASSSAKKTGSSTSKPAGKSPGKSKSSPTSSRSSKSTGTKGTSGKSSSGKSAGASSRKSPAKKPSSPAKKTTPAKGSAPASNDPREQIISEVVGIARELDDAGLQLLLEQAKVVRYKGQIEEFNRQLNTAATRAADARREANRPDFNVTIEQNDEYFIIQMDDARIFFNLGEMRELTRISHKAKDPAAGARLLFRWFEQERGDLLADAAISSARSPYLFELYELIISTYKVKS